MNDLLTEVIVIPAAVTLSEQYRHAFRHIDPQKPVEVSNHRRDDSQSYSLGHSVICEMSTTESRNLEIELDDDGSV